MQIVETLIGITEIATALTGFTGIVMAFGGQGLRNWGAGDRLSLAFLLEASLSAAGFALLALLIYATIEDEATAWRIASAFWLLATSVSLYRAHLKLVLLRSKNTESENTSDRIKTALFVMALACQIVNIAVWHEFAPFLGGVLLNLAGAAMQFVRLIQSNFQTTSPSQQNLQTICRFKPDQLQVSSFRRVHNSSHGSLDGDLKRTI